MHVAVIMDGNGRWAQNRKMPRFLGHREGIKRTEEIARAAPDLGIKVMTLYAFSTENWKRSGEEIGYIFKLFKSFIDNKLSEIRHEGIRLRFIGRKDRVSGTIANLMKKAEEATRENTRLLLNVGIDYGGRDEIARTTKKFSEQVKRGNIKPEDLTEEMFTSMSDLKDIGGPDVLIRTGGDRRVSNFLLWHTIQSELIFEETLWPDFNTEKLARIITHLPPKPTA